MMTETKKSREGLITFFILLLVIVIAFLVFFNKSSGDFEGWPDNYRYKGLNKTYEFTVDNTHPDVTYHVLNFFGPGGFFRQEYNVPFEFSPVELEYMSVPEGLRNLLLDSRGIFITRDPALRDTTGMHDIVAITTIARITGNESVNTWPHVYGIPTFSAYTKFNQDEPDTPVLTCENATSSGRVILLKQMSSFDRYFSTKENSIYLDRNNENCIVMEFKDKDGAVAVATRLVYSVIGVMP